MKNQAAKYFLITAGALLFVVSAAKLVSSFGSMPILQQTDPLFGIPYRSIFRLAGLLEAGVALVCWLKISNLLKAGLVAWLTTMILLYRLSMPFVGYISPCPCLGTLTTTLHISPRLADVAMKVILTYLLAGSYMLVCWLWLRRKNVQVDYIVQN